MKKTAAAFILTIICFLIIPFTSDADTGPKPSLTIIVRGMEDSEYWLDLLISGNPSDTWLEISDEEREKVSKLADYNKDGLHAALLKGTGIPLWGSLTGERQSDGSYIHKFSYMGVPKEFKIAILKNDGTLIVSDTVKRAQFQSVMEYTVGGTINEKADSSGTIKEIFPWGSYILGFVLRLIATLAIETAIALLFGFTLKKSWKPLVITNAVTQIILNIIIITTTSQDGKMVTVFAYIGAELFVILAEMLAFGILLTEGRLLRRLLYTVTANVASLVAGFLLLFIP